MKKTVLLFMTIFLAATFNGQAGLTSAAGQEQTPAKAASPADTTIPAHEEPITKTVIIEEEEEGAGESETPPRNKWITGALVLFGIVGFFILKSKRKKKPVKKEFDHK